VKEVRWLGQPKVYAGLSLKDNRPGLLLDRPKAYWVPVTKPEVIARLKLHGVQCETLTEPRTVASACIASSNPKVQPAKASILSKAATRSPLACSA